MFVHRLCATASNSLGRRDVPGLQADAPIENSSQGSGVSSQESGVSD